MRSFSYMSAIFATAFAMAAASPQQAGSSAASSSHSSSSSAASSSDVANTSMNINLKKSTSTLSNPKLNLGRQTGSRPGQSSSSSAAPTSTTSRKPLFLPSPGSTSTKAATSSKASSSTKTSSSAPAATSTKSATSKYSISGNALPSFYFGKCAIADLSIRGIILTCLSIQAPTRTISTPYPTQTGSQSSMR